MTIPPRFLDEIRSRLRLSEIIGRRVRVMRAGREFKACCPFHNEKTPSFTINDDKQFYHCFGCGAHGDVIGFVMRHDNLDFRAAVESLAMEAGLQMPRETPEERRKAQKANDLYDVIEVACQWFEEQLKHPDHADIMSYAQGRGLDESMRGRFRVGYAPADGQGLRRHLSSQGVTDAEMLEAGLLKQSDKGREPYGFFRDRLIFPVCDRRGRVVAFGGRILPDHMRAPAQSGFKPPKYLNSADSPVFDKGRMLYAEHLARRAATEGHTPIVTEGYMDVIACHRAGFKAAVAPMGTALTEGQIAALWALMPQDEKVPVLCFDGDDAGRRAAARTCEKILPMLKPSHSIRFAFLPDGQDPDSLIASAGPAALKKILAASLSLFDFLWMLHTAGREFKTPETRAGVIKALEGEIRRIADRDVQVHYQALMRARISEVFFNRSGQRGGRPNKPRGPAPLRPRPVSGLSAQRQTQILIAAVLNHPEIFDSIEESLAELNISGKGMENMRQDMIAMLSENPALDRAGLQHHLKERGYIQEISDILCESLYCHAGFVRPEASLDTVLSGWQTLWENMKKTGSYRDIRAGWRDILERTDADGDAVLRARTLEVYERREAEEAG